jgi:hypothetical protein
VSTEQPSGARSPARKRAAARGTTVTMKLPGSGDTFGEAFKSLANKVTAISAALVLLAAIGCSSLATAGNDIPVALIIFALIVVIAVFIVWANRTPRQHVVANVGTIAISDQLRPDQIDAVLAIVAAATAEVADAMKLPQDHVRGNIFGLAPDGALHMITEFSVNMSYAPEVALQIPVGQGSNGRAWERRLPNVAIRYGDFGQSELAADMTGRVEPNLTWIISYPAFSTPAAAAGPPCWILNTDGLHDKLTEKDLRKAVGIVGSWAEQLSQLLTGVAAAQGVG